jgi:hypothetical protein
MDVDLNQEAAAEGRTGLSDRAVAESMYVSAMEEINADDTAQLPAKTNNRFCLDGRVEEEDETGWGESSGEPQWTWLTAGSCSLDAERLPPLWFIENNRPDPVVSKNVPVLEMYSMYTLRCLYFLLYWVLQH